MADARNPERAAKEPNVFTSLVSLVEVDADRFVAPASPERSGVLFGGQLLAQALSAAQRTVDDDRNVHSLHAYFLKAGDVDSTIELYVERVRDGRSFSARCVRAQQNDRELFRMVLSFHVPEDGLDYAPVRMPDVAPPQEIELTYNDFVRSQRRNPDPDWDGEARPMDIRYVDAPTAPEGQPVLEDQRMWMRISERLADRQGIHDAGLAYLSDGTLVDHIVLPHGYRWNDGLFNGASLDHAMWFHRRTRADEWLLFDQSVASTGGSRGLATGRFFDADGRLVATCTQEGLMRKI
jgi:acyl-CoA thioesterase-2